MKTTKTQDTALKVCEYLGLGDGIANKPTLSIYIIYTHNNITYQLRISDHCANPNREDFIKSTLGYTPINLTNNWDIAKRIIDRRILNIAPSLTKGTKINHPVYGVGEVVSYEQDVDKLLVQYGDVTKAFCGSIIMDRGYIM